jgi:hypothetical protein
MCTELLPPGNYQLQFIISYIPGEIDSDLSSDQRLNSEFPDYKQESYLLDWDVCSLDHEVWWIAIDLEGDDANCFTVI